MCMYICEQFHVRRSIYIDDRTINVCLPSIRYKLSAFFRFLCLSLHRLSSTPLGVRRAMLLHSRKTDFSTIPLISMRFALCFGHAIEFFAPLATPFTSLAVRAMWPRAVHACIHPF